MMLLVAGKKMAGWSEVEKESGLVPAAEVAPYAWAHRFLPQAAAKLTSDDDTTTLFPVSTPWLNLVARGEAVLNFDNNRKHPLDFSSDSGESCLFGAECIISPLEEEDSTDWFGN